MFFLQLSMNRLSVIEMQIKSIKPETTATAVAFNAIAIPNASMERMETIARSGISFVFIVAKV